VEIEWNLGDDEALGGSVFGCADEGGEDAVGEWERDFMTHFVCCLVVSSYSRQ